MLMCVCMYVCILVTYLCMCVCIYEGWMNGRMHVFQKGNVKVCFAVYAFAEKVLKLLVDRKSNADRPPKEALSAHQLTNMLR